MHIRSGRMAEWSNAAVLKTAEPETAPGVRIPLLPPPLKDYEGEFGDRSPPASSSAFFLSSVGC